MTDVNLSEIQSLAAKVGAQHEELTAAQDAERASQEQLLDAVVAAAKPALRALSSRIKTRWRSWWIGTTRTDDESDHAAVRGLVVSDAKAGPSRGNPGRDENRGTFSGYDLFLTADGRWLELAYTGNWSHWQGESDEWNATERYLDTATVVREWDHEVIVHRVVEALKQQAAGKAPDRAKAAQERAERLGALAKLL